MPRGNRTSLEICSPLFARGLTGFPKNIYEKQTRSGIRCHRNMTAASFSKMLFPFLLRHSKRKKCCNRRRSRIKVQDLLFIFSELQPSCFCTVQRVQLKLNTEGTVLLSDSHWDFFFSKLNSVLAWENFLVSKLKQYSQDHFHFSGIGVNVTKLESLTWSWR